MNTLEKTHFNDFTENCHLKEWGFLGKHLTKKIVNHIHYAVFVAQLKPLSNGCTDSVSALNNTNYSIEFFRENHELIKEWLLRKFNSSNNISNDIVLNTKLRFQYQPTRKAVDSVWLNNDINDTEYAEMAVMITKIIAIETAISFSNFVKFHDPISL